MNFLSFWRSDTHLTSGTLNDPLEYSEATVADRNEALATVGTLLDMVDIERLITTRDRISPLSNTGALADIPTQTAYREYLRFLTIKILSVNVPALALSPSWYIDQLWHSHILDTEAYAQLREKWPGRLQHDPVPTGDQWERLRRTLWVYEQLFKESPLRSAATKAIWSEDAQSLMGTNGSASTAPGGANQSLYSPNSNHRMIRTYYPSISSPSPSEPEIQPPPYIINPPRFLISLREKTGKLTTMGGSRTMTILDLKNNYRERGGPPVKDQMLMFSGFYLEDSGTLEEYNIQNGSSIDVHINGHGARREELKFC